MITLTREQLELLIPVIPEDINYWLVRAHGGKYFDDFLNNEFIAVDSFSIKLDDFLNIPEPDLFTSETYKYIIANYVRDVPENNITYASKRIFTFIDAIKTNDIIITPSKKSTHFLIGVAGELYNEENPLEFIPDGRQTSTLCKYNLRRKVQWYKIIKACEMDDKLNKIKSSQHTILNINKYSSQLDRLLFQHYFKGDKFYFNYRVGTSNDITVDTWKKFQDSLSDNLGPLASETVLKQNVQSIGDLLFSTNWNNVIECLKAMGPISLAIAAGFGLKGCHVKIGENEITGIIPLIFFGSALKKKLKESESIKDNEKEKELLAEIASLRQTLENEIAKNDSNVPTQVHEMKILPKNVGTVIQFRKLEDNDLDLDER